MKLSRLFSSLLPPPAPWGRTLFAVTLATLATTWAVQSATPAVAQLPVVSLDATVEFTSEPAPNIRVQPGVFTIKRSGDLSHDLTVFLKYEGSATPDVDYVKLPDTLTIPAGQASAELLVTALEDSLAEGIETVAAWLVDPPVDRVPDQVIDPAHNVAKIIINDVVASTPSPVLEITLPRDGDLFAPGQSITLNATAIDPNGYIAHVDFYDSDTLLGSSQIDFIRAPDPGTPIYHSFQWQGAPAGGHILMARAVVTDGHPLISKAVEVKVTEPITAPVVTITRPRDGEVLEQGAPVTIEATAIDPKGYIARVEFYDFETLLGSSQLAFFRAPDPGTPIYHSFHWSNAAAGGHFLTVRATDSQGNPVVSSPVKLQLTPGVPLPLVQIKAVQAEATELPPLVDVIDPAIFSVSREGDLTQDLEVVFSLHGTAQPGKDYTRQERYVIIPAGQSEVTFSLAPLADGQTENMETIAIRLEDPMPISALPAPPTPYSISSTAGTAVAVIYDQNRLEQGALELALPDDGAVFQLWQPLTILAALSLPTAAPSHVDFYIDDQPIGSSDMASASGLVVHRLDWKAPGPGDQVITARAKAPDGTDLLSSQIHITVKDPDQGLPVVSLVAPQIGAVFAPGDSIEIDAVTRDPKSAIQTLDILADDQVLGSTTNSTLSVKTSTLTTGPHVLVARAVDSAGNPFLSMPVKILVWTGDGGGSGGSAGPAEVTQIARQANNRVDLHLAGPANGLCLLEVSTDLVNWTAIPPVFLPDGKIVVEEDASNGPSQRFYRTRAR